MNICVVSNLKGNPDEGMKNFAIHIARELSDLHNVMHINGKESVFSSDFWKKLKIFNPDIIHFFLRPTISTLVLSKIMQFYGGKAKLVLSALQPPKNPMLFKKIARIIKPDLVLIQSNETENIFSSIGCRTTFLPSGVDTESFKPTTNEIKKNLRKKYGIEEGKFVVLHVGHINKGRNLYIFKKIATTMDNTEILIIGSTNKFNFDEKMYNELKNSGCNVKREYFDNIEEIYQLSDCYVFPTMNSSFSIEIPLSILEAMACNLPVISTKFGGLTKIFKEHDEIYFVNSVNEISDMIEFIKNNELEFLSRNHIIDYSWRKVAEYLDNVYNNIIMGGL